MPSVDGFEDAPALRHPVPIAISQSQLNAWFYAAQSRLARHDRRHAQDQHFALEFAFVFPATRESLLPFSAGQHYDVNYSQRQLDRLHCVAVAVAALRQVYATEEREVWRHRSRLCCC